MIDIKDIEIDDQQWRIAAARSSVVTKSLLVDTINDLARQVEAKAKEFAPLGLGENQKDVPGTLKKEGIVRHDAHIISLGGDLGQPGSFVTDSPAIGGGFSVRGGNPANRGQFSRRIPGTPNIPGTKFLGGGIGGSRVVAAVVELNPMVRHAEWVHRGTGIYGPHHAPIRPRVAPFLVFRWHGRFHAKTSVRGQKPQPFLTESYIYVNNIYAPARLSVLRAELGAEL